MKRRSSAAASGSLRQPQPLLLCSAAVGGLQRTGVGRPLLLFELLQGRAVHQHTLFSSRLSLICRGDGRSPEPKSGAISSSVCRRALASCRSAVAPEDRPHPRSLATGEGVRGQRRIAGVSTGRPRARQAINSSRLTYSSEPGAKGSARTAVLHHSNMRWVEPNVCQVKR